MESPLPEPTPYPFAEPLTFRDARHTERLGIITGAAKQAVPTLYPALDLHDHLLIGGEVRDLLYRCGLGFLLLDDPGTYQNVVEEFLCSLDVVREGRRVTHWRFILGVREFFIGERMIREWLSFPLLGGEVIVRNEHLQSRFWRDISGRHEWFAPSYNASAIALLIWKIIHHIIAIGINTRGDMARAVTGPDFELMMAINEGDALDWISILSSRFESIVKKSSRNSALGGGSMITLIAMMDAPSHPR
ncbi:unnamed protein product [Rhodiola kirilowii]